MYNYRFIGFIFILFSKTFLYSQDDIVFNGDNNGSTFNTCDAFLVDSGPVGAGYSNNEDVTVTICPTDPNTDDLYVQFTNFSLDPVGGSADNMFVYDGDDITADLIGVYTGYELQGIVLTPTLTNLTKCLTFRFVSDDEGTGRFSGRATCTPPCQPPVTSGVFLDENGDTVSGDSLALCLGELFSIQGSVVSPAGYDITDYSWLMGETSIINLQNVVDFSYDTPGFYMVRLIATDENGCESMNVTGLRVYVAPSLSWNGFPTDTTICLGVVLDVNADYQNFGSTWTGFPSSSVIEDGCVDDAQVGTVQSHSINLGGFLPGATLDDITDLESICIEMEHSFMGDFVLQVQCPSGQNVMLHNQGGGNTFLGEPVDNDNTPVDCSDPSTIGVGYNYCFTPIATQTWSQASGSVSTLPVGDYASVQPLTNLLGCPLNGTWTIFFTDNLTSDDGTLFSFSINVNPELQVDVYDFSVSVLESESLSSWETSYPWSSISDNGNLLTLDPDVGGEYAFQYTATDDFGCVSDSTFTLTVVEPESVQLNDQNPGCDGVLVLEGNVGSNNGEWSVMSGAGVSFSSNDLNTTLSYGDVGNVTIVYTLPATVFCPSNTSSMEVSFLDQPWTQVSDNLVCVGETFVLIPEHVSQNETYVWNTGFSGANLSVTETGNYTVTVSNGCGTYSDEAQISFIICDIELPNVFTPNDDNVNDVFQLISYDGITDFTIVVLNRWGNLVFESNEANFEWDGTDQNKNELTDGVYFYKANMTKMNGEPIEKSGFVHLLRNKKD